MAEEKETKQENKQERKEMNKPTEKKEEKMEKKEKKKEVNKKTAAVVRGVNLSLSYKISGSVCRMIRKKEIDDAIRMLEEVLKFKRVVPMNNMEIPHRKGKGVMAGRYPLGVCKEIIDLLKQLKANSSVNGLNNPIIFLAKADKASSPFRREGRRAKRANIYLEAREKEEIIKKENKK